MIRAVKYAVAWSICALALLMVGCASNIDKARMAVTAASTLAKSASDLYVAIDASKQADIASELAKDHDIAKAEKARDAWRANQAVALKVIKTYGTTVAAVGAAAEIQNANGTLKFDGVLGQLLNAYQQLQATLAQYGVALPTGGI